MRSPNTLDCLLACLFPPVFVVVSPSLKVSKDRACIMWMYALCPTENLMYAVNNQRQQKRYPHLMNEGLSFLTYQEYWTTISLRVRSLLLDVSTSELPPLKASYSSYWISIRSSPVPALLSLTFRFSHTPFPLPQTVFPFSSGGLCLWVIYSSRQSFPTPAD